MSIFPACDMFHGVKVIRPRSGERQGRRQGDFWPSMARSPSGLGEPQQAFSRRENRKCLYTCLACR